MPEVAIPQLVELLKSTLGVALTRPSVTNMLIIALGWVMADEGHAITSAIVGVGANGKRHHEAFHRFFSRGTWSPDRLGYWLLVRLQPHLLDSNTLCVAIDDTVSHRKGAQVFGIGSHLDAVRSTKAMRVFAFGHCWVVLCATVQVPFSHRVWALPLLFRLYRTHKDCDESGGEYRKKTELAREMLDLLCQWTVEKGWRIQVSADSAYCNDTVTRGLPERVVLFGSMRPDAVLTEAPPRRVRATSGGRPRKRGDRLPKPEQIAHDDSSPWQSLKVTLYGGTRVVRYKTLKAQWYRACGVGLLRIVIVDTSANGKVPLRVFFCTDATLSVRNVLQGYSQRWSIEVFFREAKQLLGFGEAPVRKPEAVLRVAPFTGMLYTVLVLWFLDGVYQTPLATPPVRPWYTHKRGLAFTDILRTARRSLASVEVLVPSKGNGNLRNQSPAIRTRAKARVLMAA